MYYRIVLGVFGIGRQQLLSVCNDLFRGVNHYQSVFPGLFTLSHTKRLCSTGTTSNNQDGIVYQGPLSRQIFRVKLFSFMTSMSGIFAQPVIMERANELGTSTAAIILICSFVGFFTFVTPLLLHYVTKKYVIAVLYNAQDDSYTATTYTLFLRTKDLHLKPGEGVLPDVPGMFTSLTVRGIPLFIDARYFSDVHHYKRIMGFDQPIDFKLKIDSTSKEEQS